MPVASSSGAIVESGGEGQTGRETQKNYGVAHKILRSVFPAPESARSQLTMTVTVPNRASQSYAESLPSTDEGRGTKLISYKEVQLEIITQSSVTSSGWYKGIKIDRSNRASSISARRVSSLTKFCNCIFAETDARIRHSVHRLRQTLGWAFGLLKS